MLWYAIREAMKNVLVMLVYQLSESKLFSGIQVSSTDLYISVVRTLGEWALHLGGICCVWKWGISN